MFHRTLLLCFSLVFTGCAHQMAMDSETSHPANPSAAEASAPMKSDTLNWSPGNLEKNEPDHGGMDMKGMDMSEHSAHQMNNPAKAPAKDSGSAAPGATLYTCPMHPEVVQDQPGKCPKCGMTLKKKSTSTKQTTPDTTGGESHAEHHH